MSLSSNIIYCHYTVYKVHPGKNSSYKVITHYLLDLDTWAHNLKTNFLCN